MTCCRIQILLSSYNGERFLSDQLSSLDAQRNAPEWQLLWRDDGSSDDTVSIISTHPRAHQLKDGKIRQGAARSFLSLLAAAPDQSSAFAFCDQDDVWQPEKLAWAWEWIISQPSNRPALYFARQYLTDDSLKILGPSPLIYREPGFRNALVQNIAAGNTIMLNRAARELILAAPSPPITSMHDWWCYLIVSGAGGNIFADPRAVVLYRQHSRNLVGAPHTFFRRALGALRRGSMPFMRTLSAHLKELQTTNGIISMESMKILHKLIDMLNAPRADRIQYIFDLKLYRQTFAEDLILLFYLLSTKTDRLLI